MEYGEGTIEALKREFLEEIGKPIEIIRHYYTTDFFQKSAIKDDQIISIYYLCKFSEKVNDLIFKTDCGECEFLPLEDTLVTLITLPIDKHVIQMLINTEKPTYY